MFRWRDCNLQRQKSQPLSPPRKLTSSEKYTKSPAKKRNSVMARSLDARKSTLRVLPRYPLHPPKAYRRHTIPSPFAPCPILRQPDFRNLDSHKCNALHPDHGVRNPPSRSTIYRIIRSIRARCRQPNAKKRHPRRPIRLNTLIIQICINNNIILSLP